MPLAARSFFAALCLLAAACASGKAIAAPGDYYCYVSVGGENRIAVYKLDMATGALTAAGDVKLDGQPGALTIDSSGKFLYASVRTKDELAALAIDPRTGGLTLLNTIPSISGPTYVATDPSRTRLFAVSYFSGDVAVYSIGEDGRLVQQTQSFKAEEKPHSINFDPAGRFVFVPNCGASTILQFRLDAAGGRLVPNDTPKVTLDSGTGPRHFVFHPTLNVAYFVNETASSVTSFAYDKAKGTLTPIETLSTLPDNFSGQNTCADIHVTPDGKFVYCSNRGHDSLAGFRVDPATGRLTALGATPTEKTPREFAIDPTGQYVYSAGQASGRMQAYKLDRASGRLDKLRVYDVGKGPAWVLVARLPE